MLRISEIKLDLDCDFHDIEDAVVKTLRISKNRILKTEIFKQSVDCRKGEVRFVFTADVTVDGDEDKILVFSKVDNKLNQLKLTLKLLWCR